MWRHYVLKPPEKGVQVRDGQGKIFLIFLAEHFFDMEGADAPPKTDLDEER